ncbi:MAG: D-alanyl-D-alanine carboxypeptidase family protein [Oscillospiraceae bacterium]
MKKLRILPLFLCVVLILCPLLTGQAAALEEPDVSSPTALVIDRNTGDVLYSRNPEGRVYPASTTKIMTVLLAVEAIEDGTVSLADEVTATESMNYDLVGDGSSAGIVVGETMTLENLLYCAMLSSGNDACNVIAEYISGSIPAFVALMNSRAAEMGCTGTHFTNTHGLPDDNHYSTAWDMALISMEAARHDLFMKICSTASIDLPATNQSRIRQLRNSNALICDESIYGNKYLYEYASGIKTGHTEAAGYCLVATTSKGGIDLLIAVFGGSQTYASDGSFSYSNFADTITLSDWVFNNFSYQEILASTENVSSVPVKMGADADTVNLRPSASLSSLLPTDFDMSQFQREITIYSERDGVELVAPVSAGEVLGEISLTKDGVSYGTVSLVASASVDLSHSLYIKSELSKTLHSTGFKVLLTVVIVIILLYTALVVIYRVRRIRHKKAVRAARLEQARRAREAEQAPVPRAAAPSIDYFTGDPDLTEDIPAAVKPTPVSPAPRPAEEAPAAPPSQPAPRATEEQKAKAERDYFEEFFRQK